MKVRILTDESNEMLVIEQGGSTLFEGNYWDFNVPSDIVYLLSSLSINVSSEDFVYEIDEDNE